MSFENNANNVQNTETREVTKDSSYYNNLFLVLDAELNAQSSLAERVEILSRAWSVVRQFCLHSIRDTNEIVCWIQRHTARTVLERERSPSIKAELKKLEASLDTFTAACKADNSKADNSTLPWEKELLQKVAWFKNLLVDAWDIPFLKSIKLRRKTKKHEYKEWLKQEGGVIFAERVLYLSHSKHKSDWRFAQYYVTKFMNLIRDEQTCITDEEYLKDNGIESSVCSFETELRSDALFDQVWDDLVDLECILLHKLQSYYHMNILVGNVARVIPLKRGHDVVTRLLNKPQGTYADKILWEDAEDVAHVISQVLLYRYVQVPRWCSAVERAVRSLVGTLVRTQRYSRRYSLSYELSGIVWLAVDATHIVTLRDAIREQGAALGMKPESIKICEEAILNTVSIAERRKFYGKYKVPGGFVKSCYESLAYGEHLYVTDERVSIGEPAAESSLNWCEQTGIWFRVSDSKIVAARSNTAQCSQEEPWMSSLKAHTNLDSNIITYDESNERNAEQSSSQIPTTDKTKDTSNADKNSSEQIKRKTKDSQMLKRKLTQKASPIDDRTYSSSDGDTLNEEDNNMTDKYKDNSETDKNSREQIKRKTKDSQMLKRKFTRKASPIDDRTYSSSDGDTSNEEDNNMTDKYKDNSETDKNSREQIKRKTKDSQMLKRKFTRKASPIDARTYSSSDGDTSNEEDNNITDKSKDNSGTDKNSRRQVKRKTKDRQIPKPKVLRKSSSISDSLSLSNDRNVNILSQNQEINGKDNCNADKNLETQDINEDSSSSTSDSDTEDSSFDEEIKTIVENMTSKIFKILMKEQIKVNSPICLFQCKKCSVNFSSESHFLKHLPDCRFDIDTYDCKTCGLKFPLHLKEKHLRLHKEKQNLCFNVSVESACALV